MELEDNFKRLVKELGHAINDSVSDSERIADVLGRIRAAGYDLFLVLEVTIGFNKRETHVTHRQKLDPERRVSAEAGSELRLTNHDTQFLRDLRISVEDQSK